MDFTWVRKFHQAKVQSPSSNFHKHDSFYLESYVESNQMIKSLKVPWSGSGLKKVDIGHLGLKGLSSYKSRTLAPILTNRASVYPES